MSDKCDPVISKPVAIDNAEKKLKSAINELNDIRSMLEGEVEVKSPTSDEVPCVAVEFADIYPGLPDRINNYAINIRRIMNQIREILI